MPAHGRGPSDDAEPPALEGGDMLEGGAEPFRWRRRWTALPPWSRRLALAIALVVLVGEGLLQVRTWAAERALQQQVLISTSLEVESNSTSPPGGAVRYYVAVRNDGSRPLWVTSVESSTERLRLRMLDDGDRRVDAGGEIRIPMSVLLTCAQDGAAGSPPGLSAEVRLRREDAGSTARRVELRPAALVLDVAATLCTVRPGLRSYELSGPVLRAR